MKRNQKIIWGLAAVLVAGTAFAQKAGDNIFSVGLASINSDVSLGKLTNQGPVPAQSAALNNIGFVGASATVSSETTISASWLHMYTDNLGAEFTFGRPPRVTQGLNTPGMAALAKPTSHSGAARISIWTPTIVGKYFFGTPAEQWRPYVGLGVSRVSFHKIDINGSDATVRDLAGYDAHMTSSWAPVYSAGLIYKLNDKWSVTGSVAYIPIKTTATFTGVAGVTTGDVKLETIDYVVRVGYRF